MTHLPLPPVKSPLNLREKKKTKLVDDVLLESLCTAVSSLYAEQRGRAAVELISVYAAVEAKLWST